MKIKNHILLLSCVVAAFLNAALAHGAYLYGLNFGGAITCNGNKINSYSSGYDSGDSATIYLAWQALEIVGGDQYALRADGLYYLNGVKQWKLPYNSTSYLWTCLKISNGSAYALRQDGGLAVSNSLVANLPLADLNFRFTSLQVVSNDTYSLRSDGSVFKNAGSTPIYVFNAGTGINGNGDGYEFDTRWYALRVKPGTPYIYALRSDGELYRALLGGNSNSVEYVDSLPFDLSNIAPYWDFGFDDSDSTWVALRTDGKVYREGNSLQPDSDFNGNINSYDSTFINLAIYQGQYFALRGDGKVYAEGQTNPVLDLPGGTYGEIAVSSAPPNLASQKNTPPFVVQYTITVNTNLPVKVPVIATDIETPTDELIITPVSWPTGAVWNASAREFTWTAPALKGGYTFSYSVTDNSGTTKTYKSKVNVKYPDLVPEKNKPPYVPNIKNATALVGQEYRIYIPLGDPDNDPVSVTIDPSKYPFTAGAIYDGSTGEFVWTPTNADIGKWTAPFTFSDGVTTKTFKLKLQVKSPLYVEPLP
jgi:hypothetical protein